MTARATEHEARRVGDVQGKLIGVAASIACCGRPSPEVTETVTRQIKETIDGGLDVRAMTWADLRVNYVKCLKLALSILEAE